MILNQRQIRYLKSEAMNMKALYQIGKESVSDNFLDMIDKALEARELIKIKVLQNSSANPREDGLDIASKTNATLIQVVGKVITLYRPSKKNIYPLPR